MHAANNVLNALPKSAQPAARRALAEIRDAEDRAHAEAAIASFVEAFGSKWPKAAAKVTDKADALLCFFDFPAEHWVHLKTTNPIESTFATVRLRTKVTNRPGSRAAGLAMAFKLIGPGPVAGGQRRPPRRPGPGRRQVPQRCARRAQRRRRGSGVTTVRDDTATTACGVCGSAFDRAGRQRFCSTACRQTAWRRRRLAPIEAVVARADTVYEYPDCEARYLGDQRCDECNTWCRRVGPGGTCPCCEEPVAIADLIAAEQFAPSPVRPIRRT